jgi:hypothetical protein
MTDDGRRLLELLAASDNGATDALLGRTASASTPWSAWCKPGM